MDTSIDNSINTITQEIYKLKTNKFRKVFFFMYSEDTKNLISEKIDELINFYLIKKEYNKCAELYLEKLNYNNDTVDIYKNAGDMFYKNYQYANAIDNYINATVSRQITIEKLLKLLIKIADCYDILSNTAKAIEYYNKAIDICASLDSKQFDAVKLKLILINLYFQLINVNNENENENFLQLIKLYSEISIFYANNENIKFSAREYIIKEILCTYIIFDVVSAKIKYNTYISTYAWLERSNEFTFLNELFSVLELRNNEFDDNLFKETIRKFDDRKVLDPIYIKLLTCIRNKHMNTNLIEL
jgi:tetratricopeptide (TPR) repeat protein